MNDQAPPSAGASRPSAVSSTLASLPSVDRLLREPALGQAVARFGREPVKRALQEALDAARARIAAGDRAPDEAALTASALERVSARLAPRIVPVINLTGTVIHTNLGRALLAEEAIESVAAAMRGYGALEYDLSGGERGDRDSLVADLLTDLTGAQAVTIVNNNAAAVLIALSALASRKEAVISNGELVEIGGAFRMPDVMRTAGCRLVAVGTTNRTHARDYASAIGPRTGVVVKAHPSNYAISGFTQTVDEATIARIAHEAGVPLLVDLGAGALVDLSAYGLPREPLPRDSLDAGADVVTFSGDKLLGGPQAGILVGTRTAIDRIRRHPLKRALRCSKLTLAALEATLRVYASGDRLHERLPVLAMLTRSPQDIRGACMRVQPALARFAGPAFGVEIRDCASQIGSGSLPVERLPSFALVATPIDAKRSGRVLNELVARLRELPTPVIGRVHERSLWLDARCLRAAEEAVLLDALRTNAR